MGVCAVFGGFTKSPFFSFFLKTTENRIYFVQEHDLFRSSAPASKKNEPIEKLRQMTFFRQNVWREILRSGATPCSMMVSSMHETKHIFDLRRGTRIQLSALQQPSMTDPAFLALLMVTFVVVPLLVIAPR